MKKFLSIFFCTIFLYHFFAQAPKNTRTFETNLSAEYPGFIKHLTENSSETYYASFSYNGPQIIRKFGSDGLLKWKISITNGKNSDLSLSKHYISVDKNDNIIICFNPTGFDESIFTDAYGISQNLSVNGYTKVILKIDKYGKLVWKKNFSYTYNGHAASVYTDNNNDIYFTSLNQTSENSQGYDHFLISKLNGVTGDVIYSKDYKNVSSYSSFSVIDNQDNFYVFLDSNTTQANYNFDGINIEKNFSGDNIMLKFDKTGTIIFGKNFYSQGNDFDYSILSDGIFDGNNIVLLGYLLSSTSGNFKGLDDFFISPKYSNVQHQGLLAKIDTSGNVIFQKPIFSNNYINYGVFTNVSVDADKNIYSYLYFKDKVSINDIEYQFDINEGNKVISKFDTNGNVIYLKAVDTKRDVANYYSSTHIDVIKNDVYNCSGVTDKNYLLNYPLYNYNIPKNYIATFGELDRKYLSPQTTYLLLTNTRISNNPNNDNIFSFNLINNVNWTAMSDQNWLSLSFTNLTEKSTMDTIFGIGDAQIKITAETNTTGTERSANIIFSGDNGVDFKTVVVTQSGLLSSTDVKTFTTVIYPNPASDVLNIQAEQKITKIEIFDLSGKLLISKYNKENINISNLSKGIYIIKIHTLLGTSNSKFIKN